MIASSYDLVTVGGGIGGAVLGKVMAEHGARVLILEKDRVFKDRVRGDAMAPWGVPEARQLGLEGLLLDTCAQQVPWVDSFIGELQIEHRHLPSTTRCQTAEFAFHHPAMQEVVLQAAADAGAEVVRGAVAREIEPGDRPGVTYLLDGASHVVRTRLVVGADGRLSATRRLGGFEVQADPAERILSGVLLEGMQVQQDTCYSVFDTRRSQLVALFPQGNDRVRAYFSYPNHVRPRLQGGRDVPELMDQAILAGAPAEWFRGARGVAPLASFPSDDTWVPHPYRSGVVLIGDAAANNDPMFGQGLAITLRDVRELWQQLIATDDWDAACHAYARAHDDYFNIIHTYSHWFEQIFYQTGHAADMLRLRLLTLYSKDRSRMPDYFMSGPYDSVSEDVRRRMFGEDLQRPPVEPVGHAENELTASGYKT